MNSWNSNIDSGNFNLRKACLDNLNLDVVCIAETHLKYDDTLILQDYVWYGNNRKLLHRNAWSGSGGVGVFIKKWMFKEFIINIIDQSCDDILWLSLKDKSKNIYYYMFVCYLPPKYSSRQIDASRFFDSLLSSIYEYQNKGTVFMCGDFNSRCGDKPDFIEGIDEILMRNVVDFTSNEYSDILIDFLIS